MKHKKYCKDMHECVNGKACTEKCLFPNEQEYTGTELTELSKILYRKKENV